MFLEGERKKGLERGSNSTTRAWRVTGMEPSDPYSLGWNDNIGLYAKYNGMKITNNENRPYYVVCPKDNILCPQFTDNDIKILNEEIPVLAASTGGQGRREGDDDEDEGGKDDTYIASHPKSKCYVVAERIITSWIEIPSEERPATPISDSANLKEVEKLALQHMDIAQLIKAEPKTKDSLLLDEHYNNIKREARLTTVKPMETIEVKPKDSKNEDEWHKALRMKRDDMWNVFDGNGNVERTTNELRENYIINLKYRMFPDDKRLIKNEYESDRRRDSEKRSLLKRLAKTYAEEERDACLEEAFNRFMALPK